jgi:hypothetical protein
MLGTAALLAIPSVLCAETVYIKNDTNIAIVVEVSVVIGGKVVRDRPAVVKPGDAAVTMLPGNKIVLIQDARFLKPLYNGVIPGDKDNQAYSAQADGPTRIKLEKK